jgi:hypothetical protein
MCHTYVLVYFSPSSISHDSLEAYLKQEVIVHDGKWLIYKSTKVGELRSALKSLGEDNHSSSTKAVLWQSLYEAVHSGSQGCPIKTASPSAPRNNRVLASTDDLSEADESLVQKLQFLIDMIVKKDTDHLEEMVACTIKALMNRGEYK